MGFAGLAGRTAIHAGGINVAMSRSHVFLVLAFLLAHLSLAGQESSDSTSLAADTSARQAADTLSPVLPADTSDLSLINEMLQDTERADRAVSEVEEADSEGRPTGQATDNSLIVRFQKLEELARELNELDRLLNRDVDTVDLRQEVEEYAEDIALIQQIYNTYPEHLNFTALNAIEVSLQQIEDNLDQKEVFIVQTYKDLLLSRQRVFDLFQEVSNIRPGQDSMLQQIFQDRLASLNTRWREVIDAQRERIGELSGYQNMITANYLEAESLLEQTQRLIQVNQKRIFRPEFPPLWNSERADYLFASRPSLQRSLSRAVQVADLYFGNNWGKFLVIPVVIFGFFFWINQNLQYYRRNPDSADAALSPLRYLNAHPRISSVLPGLLLMPILFGDAPHLVTSLIWLSIGITAFPLVRSQWPVRSNWICDALFLLFFLTGLAELLLFPSLAERLANLVFSVSGILIAIVLVREARNLTFSYPWLIRIANYFLLGVATLGLLFNVFGYFSLAKGYLNAGFTSMVFAFVMTVLVKLIMEALYLQGQLQEKGSRFSFWFKYQDFEKRLNRILVFIAAMSWGLITLKDAHFLELAQERVQAFLGQDRVLGDIIFSWGDVFIFLFILWVSMILSRIIKYIFGSVKDVNEAAKSNAANYMLIIRLLILAGGFLLAMSAAGIPLDKVAIVLGALGVGIGFGLQNIVNNLVSGIILAFERPVKIGDVVELGTEMGKVKEIGMRSSRIAKFDGSEVIVPNGDLLSGRIINWTMNDENRRLELIVGVGYGSDVDQVKSVIQSVLAANAQVLNWPKPLILVREMNSSSLDFRVLFWINKIDEWLSIQSDVLGEIYNQIRAAGIEIPFPKRDIKVSFENNRPNGLPASPESEQAGEEDPQHQEPSSR